MVRDVPAGSPEWIFLATCHYVAKCVHEIMTENGNAADDINGVVEKITPGDPDRPFAVASQ